MAKYNFTIINNQNELFEFMKNKKLNKHSNSNKRIKEDVYLVTEINDKEFKELEYAYRKVYKISSAKELMKQLKLNASLEQVLKNKDALSVVINNIENILRDEIDIDLIR